jgi:hypothetical protein
MNQLSLLYTSIFLLHNNDNSIDDYQDLNPVLLIILTTDSAPMLDWGEGGVEYKGLGEG